VLCGLAGQASRSTRRGPSRASRPRIDVDDDRGAAVEGEKGRRCSRSVVKGLEARLGPAPRS